MCQVWSLPDPYDGQGSQFFHNFTVYVKGASPFEKVKVYIVRLGPNDQDKSSNCFCSTCVNEVDHCNNDGRIDLMKEWVAVEVDSAHVIAVLFEGMPARSFYIVKARRGVAVT